MERDRQESDWQGQTEELRAGMREWRTAHPNASFADLEDAVEARLARLRARMLEDAAVAAGAEARGGSVAGAACSTCQQPLVGRGRKPRTITVAGNQTVCLEREYGVCPTCKVGLFPPR